MNSSPSPILQAPSSFEREALSFLQGLDIRQAQPSLEQIRSVSRYFSRLPYENISKILKQHRAATADRLRLPDELLHDHLTWHAGGTCFSLTYFLCGIYTTLGYDAQPLIGHLNWAQNTHSAVAIDFRGHRYLVDPGYMIFNPLPLSKQNQTAGLSAETGLSLRFSPELDEYALYTFRKQQFTRRYRFRDHSLTWDEFAQHWQASFELPGMQNVTLTRFDGHEMLFIQGDFIKITAPERTHKLRDPNQAEHLIRDRFGIPLEKLEEARSLIQGKPDAG